MIAKIDRDKIKFIIFFFIILLSFYRSPFIFLNGRFFAEEGSVFFVHANEVSLFKNIFFIELSAGYLNLIANILVGISAKFPIIYSPFVTVYLSFLFVLLPPYLILFRNSELFKNNFNKFIGALIFFISTPLVPEIWLNTINLQVYLCLSSILIIFMHKPKFYQKIFNSIILILGGFSGVYTCALLPLFFLKFLKKRNNYNLFNSLILFSTSLIQIFLIINSKLNSYLTPTVLRLDTSYESISLFIYNIIIRPIIGRESTIFFFDLISKFFDPVILFLITFSLLIVYLIIYRISFFNFLKKNDKFLILLTIFILINLIIIVGSVGSYYGGRYSAIPGVTLLLIIFNLINNTFRKKKFLLSTVLVIALINGINEFRPQDNKSSYGLKLLDCINCPIWKNEIEKWREDKNYNIGLWPYPSKKMKLNR